MSTRTRRTLLFVGLFLGLPLAGAHSLQAQLAIKGEVIHTVSGPSIENGTVVVRDGKIVAIGKSTETPIPEGYRVLEAKVVTPGLVDAHTVVGLAGQYNYDHDQDQLERSQAIQPELRALDAYNCHERLVGWVRSFGVTTVHTGHGPGQLVSGQTIVVKTTGNTVEEAVLDPCAMIAATLADSALQDGGKSPGTRGKLMALLRKALIEAQEYRAKQEVDDDQKKPPRNLKKEALAQVLSGEVPLLITAHRSQDIASVLRLKEEFGIRVVLDGGAEAYLLAEAIKASGIPVVVHPTMARAYRETKNLTMENAAHLHRGGVPIALQSGYESYVPKTRVVLFEAAIAAANGLGFDGALHSITLGAAEILGVSDRVGSLEIGKDGDFALYDGDPFEYTSHCVGVIIEGQVVSDQVR